MHLAVLTHHRSPSTVLLTGTGAVSNLGPRTLTLLWSVGYTPLEWHLGPCVLLSEASAGIHSLPAPAAPPWDHRLLCLLFHFSHPRVEQKFWILVQVKRPCVRLFWRPSLPCWPVFLSRVPHCVTYCDFKSPGTSLVVQWLRLQAPDAKTPGLIPDPGTIVYTLQLRPGHNK